MELLECNRTKMVFHGLSFGGRNIETTTGWPHGSRTRGRFRVDILRFDLIKMCFPPVACRFAVEIFLKMTVRSASIRMRYFAVDILKFDLTKMIFYQLNTMSIWQFCSRKFCCRDIEMVFHRLCYSSFCD